MARGPADTRKNRVRDFDVIEIKMISSNFSDFNHAPEINQMRGWFDQILSIWRLLIRIVIY